ncbi:hypothetical protein NDN08_001077 [Rhodosorus marinus]|uniref:GOLD domain-containing protein n=1 Tax=Rhodosorus marinus TaxID=101924 RepID=A0AAV8UQ01_9RHOD|nr:hypothetical protein NDN08_001077 [Rhodosorus marinus]
MSFSYVLFALSLLILVLQVEAIQFYLRSGHKLCFTEDFEPGKNVRGEYVVMTGNGTMAVDLTVRDEKGEVAFMKRDIDHGSFTFKTREARGPKEPVGEDDYFYDAIEDEGDQDETKPINELKYELCVKHHGEQKEGVRRRVSLRVVQGAMAKDYNEMAKKEHLDELAAQLLYVTDSLVELEAAFQKLFLSEHDVRIANEKILSSMMYASLGSVAALAIFSAFYMRLFRKGLEKVKAI